MISSFICFRVVEVESLDLRSYRALIFSNISVGASSVFSRYRPEGMWYDAALRMMARKILSSFWQLVESRFLLSLFSLFLSTTTIAHIAHLRTCDVASTHGYLVAGQGFWCPSRESRRRCLGREESEDRCGIVE